MRFQIRVSKTLKTRLRLGKQKKNHQIFFVETNFKKWRKVFQRKICGLKLLLGKHLCAFKTRLKEDELQSQYFVSSAVNFRIVGDKIFTTCASWNTPSGAVDGPSILGCDVVSTGKSLQKLRSTVMPSSSWPNSLKAITGWKDLLHWITRVHGVVHHGAQRNLWQFPWRVGWSRERYHPWSDFFSLPITAIKVDSLISQNSLSPCYRTLSTWSASCAKCLQ